MAWHHLDALSHCRIVAVLLVLLLLCPSTQAQRAVFEWEEVGGISSVAGNFVSVGFTWREERYCLPMGHTRIDPPQQGDTGSLTVTQKILKCCRRDKVFLLLLFVKNCL